MAGGRPKKTPPIDVKELREHPEYDEIVRFINLLDEIIIQIFHRVEITTREKLRILDKMTDIKANVYMIVGRMHASGD